MDNEGVFRTFSALVDGKIDYLRIAVVLDSTRATRTSPSVGVWRLDHDRFVRIAASVADREKRSRETQGGPNGPPMTLIEVAQMLEETGIETRFFRLSEEVARWLDETPPEDSIDYACG